MTTTDPIAARPIRPARAAAALPNRAARHARRAAPRARRAAALLLLALTAACRQGDAPAPTAGAIQRLDAPAFRPVAFTDTGTLWGIQRGRLARLSLADGRPEALANTAWSVSAGPGVVSWRNENGTWGMRTGEQPRRLAPTELAPGYQGPPDVLWSPDGTRAILSWLAEWDAHHELLQPDGTRRTLATWLPDFVLDLAALWLDQQRVLFTIVARSPRSAADSSTFREAGWRGELAVLDLETDEFRRVSDVPDSTFLRPAGLLGGWLLVREDDGSRVLGHWLYDVNDWSRTRIELPAGITFAAGHWIVSLTPEGAAGGGTRARLHTFDRPTRVSAGRESAWAPGQTIDLGLLAESDAPPAFSQHGRRLALRVLEDGRPVLLVLRR